MLRFMGFVPSGGIVYLGIAAIIGLSAAACTDECRFDNSSFWTPRDHGVYNCIGECSSGECHLFVKGPEEGSEWESTGKSQIPRPKEMESPTDDPNQYKCECE